MTSPFIISPLSRFTSSRAHNTLQKGDIFIEHGNYAIHKLNYSTYLKDQGNENLIYSIRMEYTRRDSLMYLNYISFNNLFKSNTNKGFKVDGITFDIKENSFIVIFNHIPQRESAENRKNYDFKFDQRSFKISKVEISNFNDKEVHVFVENAGDFKIWQKPTVLIQKFKAEFQNIKDLQGNEVNEVKYKLVNQFRELFPQKLNPATVKPDTSSVISKKKPLNQSRIDSLGLNPSSYWMNTPLKEN